MAGKSPTPNYLKPENVMKECEDDRRSRLQSCLGGVTIEPMLLLLATGWIMAGVTTDQMILVKTCLDPQFNLTEEFCENIEQFSNTSAYDDVERKVAEFMNIVSIIEQTVPIFLAFYIGSWSDQWGRKPFILICISWKLVGSILNLLNGIFLSWSRWVWLWTVSASVALSGGAEVFVMVTYAFIADNSTVRQRTFRLGMVSTCYKVARPVATAMGGALFEAGGFVLVLGVSVIFFVLAWVCGVARLWTFKEVLGDKGKEKNTSVLDMVHPIHIVNTVKVIFKPRSDRKRIFLMIMFFVMLSDHFHDIGEITYEFLFTKRFFSWTVADFSWFKTVDSISTSIGMVTLLPLLHYLNATDNIIISIALISLILSNAMRGLATSYWTFYISIIIDFANGIISAPIRGQMSRCVDPSELGKVFSMLASLECLVPIISTNIYTRVYTITRDLEYPQTGACYFLSCLILTLALVATLIMSLLLRCGHVPVGLKGEPEQEKNTKAQEL